MLTEFSHMKKCLKPVYNTTKAEKEEEANKEEK